MTRASMLGGFVLFSDDFAYVRIIAAIASARHSRPHWQPSLSSQAKSGWFSQTHPTPKQMGQLLSIRLT